MKWTGLSVNSFALSVGLARGENLYQIKRGNNGISRELATLIAAKYPQISRAWLLAGEGDMFVEAVQKQKSVPFFAVDVEKYVSAPANYTSSGYVSIPGVEEAEFAAVYFGRAMGGEVPAGATVMARKIEPENLIPGGDYVVVTKGTVMLRRVRRGESDGELRLQPLDTNNFDEMRVNAADVRELYRILAVIMKKTI